MIGKIGTTSYVSAIMRASGQNAKKRFGQNFLIDQNVLSSIVEKAGVNKNINVIEIGPGLGALTEHLCDAAKKVLCYEIDSSLIPILNANLKSYDNYKIIEKDILKADVESDIKDFFGNEDIYLIANLPYYITTPILLGMLKKSLNIKKYVVMVQDEVADRICSKPDVKDYNALSIAVQYRAKATKIIDVSRNVFYPKPNVDSAVIKLDVYDTISNKANDEETFFNLIRIAFAQRRKTLVNNLLVLNLSKDFIYEMLDFLDIKRDARSEQLELNKFIEMANYLSKRQ